MARPKRTKPKQPMGRKPTVPAKTAKQLPAVQKRAAGNMLELVGGREGALHLLDHVPLGDAKADALRDMLMNEQLTKLDSNGRPAMSFAKMCAAAGYSTREFVELFANRANAEAVVTALAAKPRLVAELVDSASQKRVVCLECGGSRRIARTNEDGEVTGWMDCRTCDQDGMQLVDGNSKARELYFDQFGEQKGPAVLFDQRQDNRQVHFSQGAPGTAPSALSMIRSLEQVADVGPRKAITAGTVIESETV